MEVTQGSETTHGSQQASINSWTEQTGLVENKNKKKINTVFYPIETGIPRVYIKAKEPEENSSVILDVPQPHDEVKEVLYVYACEVAYFGVQGNFFGRRKIFSSRGTYSKEKNLRQRKIHGK